MHSALLSKLRCPACRASLELTEAVETDGEIESGLLACRGCRAGYPITQFVPRFVASRSYVDSFGFQWNRFRRTQLDSYSGLPISRERFFRETGWRPDELQGRSVLDIGCGAGRFAEVVLAAGASVTAVDYSNAVDACWLNLGPSPGLNVVQADVYGLPFEPGSFDFVYCLGVLQHTPDVEKAFVAVTQQVRRGGRLTVDVYPRKAMTYLWPKYWIRPIARRLPLPTLFRIVEAAVPILVPVRRLLGRIPGIGRKLRYAVPIIDYSDMLPLSATQLKEWAILDTFDMYASVHDHPQSQKRVRSWFESAGFQSVEVFSAGFLVGRAAKGTD